MTHFPATGVDRYCDLCKRQLVKIDDDGGVHVNQMTVVVTRMTYTDGPSEILISEVKCLKCYPEEG